MRQLILIRHAKSSWSNPDLDDFDRPLNKRGQRDLPFMAKLLSGKINNPDILISSPAKRTKLTALEFADALKYENEKIVWDKKLYLASSGAIIKILNQLNDEINLAIIVGHNPGLTDLQNLICSTEIDNIPTCGIVCMTTKKKWNEINSKDFNFDFFEYPKKYFK